jgi:hypothetical protein
MKSSFKITVLALTIVISSCKATPIPQPPTALPTLTSTPQPTETTTPEPTFTPEPSATPIVLPDELNQTFSNVSVHSRQSFEYVMQGATPPDWSTEQDHAIWITDENQLKAKALDSSNGTVFYYTREIINPNQGVFFTFKYTGTLNNFTLGFDNVMSNGERVTGAYFHSIAAEIRGRNLLVHGIQKKSQITGSMKGSLQQLLEDTWYNAVVAFDENNNYIIKVWEPNNPESQSTYFRNWAEFPHQYYFISWISSHREVVIDDFTVFEFGEIIQK